LGHPRPAQRRSHKGVTGGTCPPNFLLTLYSEWCKFEEKIQALPLDLTGGSAFLQTPCRLALRARHGAPSSKSWLRLWSSFSSLYSAYTGSPDTLQGLCKLCVVTKVSMLTMNLLVMTSMFDCGYRTVRTVPNIVSHAAISF
jgi:hypothetical protein